MYDSIDGKSIDEYLDILFKSIWQCTLKEQLIKHEIEEP